MRSPTLTFLEEKLRNEAPAISWHCEPATSGRAVPGTNLPEEIEVRASREGKPVKGSPYVLSGESLLRWGVDASAMLICKQLTPNALAMRMRAGLDWDRLAEI